MPYRNAMAESVKEEVLAELSRNGYGHAGVRGSWPEERRRYSQTDRAMVDSMKTDIMAQIEAEQEMMGKAYSRPATERAMVENIKKELLAEIDAAYYGRFGLDEGWRNVVSDRNIDRMINQHHRNLNSLRGEIRQELQAIRDIEKRMSSIPDPQVRDTVRSIVRESRQEGIPLDQVINRLNDRAGVGLGQKVTSWFNSTQGRSFLWGIGATVVATMLFPATRNGLRNVAVKMMEGSMNLADQANSALGRAKEGFEDMIAEANFHNMQEENQGFNEEELPRPDHPQDEEPIH